MPHKPQYSNLNAIRAQTLAGDWTVFGVESIKTHPGLNVMIRFNRPSIHKKKSGPVFQANMEE